MDTVSMRASVIDVLGVEDVEGGLDIFGLIASVRDGLPVSAVERLANALAPTDAEFRHRFVSRATLARRRSRDGGRLTADEGDRVVRLATIWSRALEVWKTPDAARAFLFRPTPFLKGETPLELALGTEIGAGLVDQLLGRIQYGSAA